MSKYPLVCREASPLVETQTVVYLCLKYEPFSEEIGQRWRQESSRGWIPFTEFKKGEGVVMGYWTDSTKFGLCWEEAAGL